MREIIIKHESSVPQSIEFAMSRIKFVLTYWLVRRLTDGLYMVPHCPYISVSIYREPYVACLYINLIGLDIGMNCVNKTYLISHFYK